jgi:tRNA dimethylallyltransferase
MNKPKIISLVGLTASGKSGLGIWLAQKFNGEIVSCDSRQVYKGLDIGSAKVTKAEQATVKHHLLDVAEPVKKRTNNAPKYFSVYDFRRLAYTAIDDILSRGKLPILVGGTGLYSRAVVEGYQFKNGQVTADNGQLNEQLLEKLNLKTLPELQAMVREKSITLNNSDFHNPRRLIRILTTGHPPLPAKQNAPRYDVLQICLLPPREFIEANAAARIDERLADGMIAETENLIASGVDPAFLRSLGLEYYWNVELIEKRITPAEYKKNLYTKTMQFAKRQRTWFKREKNTHFLTDPAQFRPKSEKLVAEFIIVPRHAD